jgi:hypothetical protein
MKLNLKLAAAASALILAAVGGSALAHPHPEGEDGERKVKKFVIIQGGPGADRKVEGRGLRIRHFDVGDLELCEGGEKIVDESAGDGKDKTKVIICRKGKGGADGASAAKRLEEALARINENDHLSDEQKARIETALRSAIDRARRAR